MLIETKCMCSSASDRVAQVFVSIVCSMRVRVSVNLDIPWPSAFRSPKA